MNIKDIVKNNTVYFLYYRQQHVYYGIDVGDTSYMFPVPLDDIQDATLNATDKAITFMRYIRLALHDGTWVEQQIAQPMNRLTARPSFIVSIDDSHCEWRFPLNVSSSLSIQDVYEGICGSFNIDSGEGELREDIT